MTNSGDMAWESGQLVDVTEAGRSPKPPDLTWTEFELHALSGQPLFGALVTLSDHRGLEHNLVVVSEPFSDTTGTWIHVVPYARFVRWSQLPDSDRSAAPAPARAVPVRNLWIMHELRTGSR